MRSPGTTTSSFSARARFSRNCSFGLAGAATIEPLNAGAEAALGKERIVRHAAKA